MPIFFDWGKRPVPIDLWIASGDTIVDAQELIVHGRDFYGISSILFDSIPVITFVALSDTMIALTVPTGGSAAALLTVIGEYGTATLSLSELPPPSDDDARWFFVL